MADVSQLLRGLFLLLKAFLQSPAKKFVVLIHSREDTETLGRLLAEGMLGLFLSAAQEHPSVQFRTLEIDRDTDLHVALRGALDRGCTVVEIIHRDGRVFTSEGHVAPSVFGDSSSLNLSPGDVVVMSGGATGISAHLARSLVPFMPRLVFLGRTSLDPGIDSAKPRPEHLSSEAFTADPRASEIARTLADLHASGIEATYHTCDVTDPEAVRAIMGEVASRYGKIDGIIHGAGVLRDGLLSQMTQDDFSMVTDVKFLGAWNLFSAAEKAGLRFFVGLSSAAAIQGNPGQANYAAANRMMSALLRTLSRKNGAIRFKALMLPPVEGAGMAEDPEVRELMKRKGVAYIHVNELAGLFCRELFVAPADDDWVMFMRRLPSVKTALLNDTTRPSVEWRTEWRHRVLEPRELSHDRKDFLPGHPPGRTRGLQIFLPGEGSLDRGSQAFQVCQASSYLRRHGSGDIHGSRPDPVSPPAGARSPPSAAHGYDPMPSWDSTVFQDLLPPVRQRPSGGSVRGLSRNTGHLPRREIDRPLHPALQRPSDP